MHLGSLTRPELIFPDLPGSDGPTVLRSFADRIAALGVVPDADELYRRLLERERLGTTALGSGVAVPHCKVDGIDEVIVAIGLCRGGVEFGAQDQSPVRLLFLVVSPSSAPAAHLQSLRAISKWVRADDHLGRMLKLDQREQIFALLQLADEE